MLLIYGTKTLYKYYKYNLTMQCPFCGRQASFRLIRTVRTFTLFFIPTIRWGKTFYLEDITNCGAKFYIDKEAAKHIAKGEPVCLAPQHMRLAQYGRVRPSYKKCGGCGSASPIDHRFCAKCGMAF